MGVLVTAVTTAIASMLTGVIGGLTLATVIGSLLGIILQIMFSGSLEIIDMATSSKFMLFEDVFSLLPYDNVNFKAIFITMAIAATVVISAWSFTKCMTAADSRNVESPAQVIKRIVTTIIILVVFIGVFMTKSVVVDEVVDGVQSGWYTTLFNYIMMPFKNMVANIGQSLNDADVAIEPYISGTFSGGYIAACILGFMLIKGCVGAALILIERVVTLVILMSLGPIAIACNASADTEEIFKKWGRTFFGTILSLMLSLCLIRVFADQMKTWVDIEKGMSDSINERISLSVTDLDEAEYNACTMGGINILYYKTETGFGRISSGDSTGYSVYWTREECQAGVKYVNSEGQDSGTVTQSAKNFATQANTYRLILAIAWITLCANSEKIINSLGFTTVVSGKLAKDFASAVKSLWGRLDHGFHTGFMQGSKFGEKISKNRADVWGNRARPAVLAQGANGKGGVNSNSLKARELGNGIETNVKDSAKKSAETIGKRMGASNAYSSGLTKAQVSNAIDNMGLTTSRGEIVSGTGRLGDSKEAKEIRGLAESSLLQGYNNAIAGKQDVLDAISDKSTKGYKGIAKSLNDSYFASSDIKASGSVGYQSMKDDYGRSVEGLVFDGVVKDENGIERNVQQGFFVPAGENGEINRAFNPYDNRVELDDEMGTVYFNTVDSNQESMLNKMDDLRDNVNDSFNDVNNNIADIYGTVAMMNDESLNMTDEEIEMAERDYFDDSSESDDEEEIDIADISNETKSLKDFDPDEEE